MRLHALARPPETMSDAIFWLPEAKTFLELHSKTLLKHFFHREHKHLLSTGTLCQVRGTLRGPCAKNGARFGISKMTKDCTTFTVPLRSCVGKYLYRQPCTWVHVAPSILAK